jgi:hypothetical protein
LKEVPHAEAWRKMKNINRGGRGGREFSVVSAYSAVIILGFFAAWRGEIEE